MRRLLSQLDEGGVEGVRLEADPPGVRLYQRLGFVDEFVSLRFALPEVPQIAGEDAATLDLSDVSRIAEFDAEYFGDDREAALRQYLGHCSGAYWLANQDGGVRGYVLALPTTQGLRLGPWVASDDAAAGVLFHTVVRHQNTRPLLVLQRHMARRLRASY